MWPRESTKGRAVSSVNFRAFVGPSVNITCGRGTFCKLLSTFHADAGPSVNFHHLSVHLRDIPSTFRASLGSSVNFCQLYKCLQELLPIFCASVGTSVSIWCRCRIFCQRWSTLRAPEGLSVKVHQLSVSSWNPMSTLCQLSVRPWDLPSTSFYFPCIRKTILQLFVCQHDLLSTFRTSAVLSDNFCQYFVHPWNFPLTFCQLLCSHGTFRQLPHILRVDAGPSVKFHQLSIRAWDISSSFCVSAGPSIQICHLQSILCLWDLLKMFRVATGPTVKFRQPSVRLRDNLLPFCASAGPSINVCQLSMRLQELP